MGALDICIGPECNSGHAGGMERGDTRDSRGREGVSKDWGEHATGRGFLRLGGNREGLSKVWGEHATGRGFLRFGGNMPQGGVF